MKNIKLIRGPFAPYTEGYCSMSYELVDYIYSLNKSSQKKLKGVLAAPSDTIFSISETDIKKLAPILYKPETAEDNVDYIFPIGF